MYGPASRGGTARTSGAVAECGTRCRRPNVRGRAPHDKITFVTRRAVFVAFSLVLAVACSSGGDGGRSTADAAPATATAPPESSTDPAEDTSTSDPTVDNTFAVPPAGPAYSADLDPGGLGLPQPPGEPFDLLDLVGALIDAGFTVRAQQGSLAPPGCGEWWESTFLRVERDALEMTDFSTWTYPDRATLETHWMVDASGSAVQREGSSCLETMAISLSPVTAARRRPYRRGRTAT